MSAEGVIGAALPAEAGVSQTHSACDDEAQQIPPRPVRRFDGIWFDGQPASVWGARTAVETWNTLLTEEAKLPKI